MEKLGKEAFLYLDPVPDADEFAQCSTCRDWVTGDDRCFIHGSHVNVPGTASCGFYVWGAALPPGSKTMSLVTPQESGLVDREVRCENCAHGGPNVHECGLYIELNEEMPEYFGVDTVIDPKGCCNAQTPRET